MKDTPMRGTRRLLALLGGLLLLVGSALAGPVHTQLHSTSAASAANGAAFPTLGLGAVAVQTTIASAWDGTLTYEVTTDGATWTAVNCRNALSTTYASTTVAAAGYVVCPVSGALSFRARISGGTTGFVTVTAGGIEGDSGLTEMIGPTGASATQVQGTAADGAAAVGNPVQVGGKDGAGNAQALSTDTSGRTNINVVDPLPAGTNVLGALSANQSVNVAQINGVPPLMGNGVTGTGSVRVTDVDNDPCQTSGRAKSSTAVGVTASAEIIAAVGGLSIYVCGYNVSLTGTTPTMQFQYGTGAVCATGGILRSGPFAPLTGSMLTYGPGSTLFSTPVSQALCIMTTGTTPSVQGVLTYVHQ